jgi:phosphatidylglycerophosphate synthase
VLDPILKPRLDPFLDRAARRLAAAGISANAVTLAGLALGLASAGLITAGAFLPALVLLGLSRIADGLDGAVARAVGPSPFGGYADICADFAFYAAIPLAFVALDPGANGVAGALLLASFYINGASFLGFAILAERYGLPADPRRRKGFHHSAGLLEASETIAFFVILCLFPASFPWLASIFALLCSATAAGRTARAYRLFGNNILDTRR